MHRLVPSSISVATMFSLHNFTFFPLLYFHIAGAYNSSLSASTNPYAMQYSTLHGSYPSSNQPSLGLGSHRLSYSTEIPHSSTSSTPINYGLYTATSRSAISNPIGLSALSSWTSTAPPLLPSLTPSVSTMQTRPSSNTGPTLHSPLTAQVYSDPSVLRTHATLDMTDAGPYSLSQRSPADQILPPECASSEPSKYSRGIYFMH